jgi:RimJ/RimL family protein N-acetyltransferase
MCEISELERKLLELKFSRVWGQKVILVRYRPRHVPKYHEWMQCPVLLHLTGSDRLTLEEEFEMQRKWVQDCDKLTFIVLDRRIYERTGGDELASMIGDTNIFLPDPNQDELIGSGEIEVMIAEKMHRQNGKGREAVRLMLRIGYERLGITRFLAKIKMDNEVSQGMFEGVGFIKVEESQVFEEVTMELTDFAQVIEYTKNYRLEADDTDEEDYPGKLPEDDDDDEIIEPEVNGAAARGLDQPDSRMPIG